MKICTYDNENTMFRECWQDGKLLFQYSCHLMYQNGEWPPPKHFFMGANIGKWKPGQIIGDIAAILPIGKETNN